MLFRGSESDCQALVNWLNSLMPGVVKFKFEFSITRIVFLDLEIFIEDGKLKTDLHIKQAASLGLQIQPPRPLQEKYPLQPGVEGGGEMYQTM